MFLLWEIQFKSLWLKCTILAFKIQILIRKESSKLTLCPRSQKICQAYHPWHRFLHQLRRSNKAPYRQSSRKIKSKFSWLKTSWHLAFLALIAIYMLVLRCNKWISIQLRTASKALVISLIHELTSLKFIEAL